MKSNQPKRRWTNETIIFKGKFLEVDSISSVKCWGLPPLGLNLVGTDIFIHQQNRCWGCYQECWQTIFYRLKKTRRDTSWYHRYLLMIQKSSDSVEFKLEKHPIIHKGFIHPFGGGHLISEPSTVSLIRKKTFGLVGTISLFQGSLYYQSKQWREIPQNYHTFLASRTWSP